MKNIRYKSVTWIALIILLIASSCEEDVAELTPDRLFRPASLAAEVNINEVTLTWVPIANASYSLEISRDSLAFTNDLQIIQLDGVAEYYMTDLYSNTLYSARIKAVSKDPSVSDSEYKQTSFTTGTENIFYSVLDEDIAANQVLLQWDEAKDVSHIEVSTEGVNSTTVSLSEQDKTSGEKLIGSLNSGTNYVFTIYLEDMLRGTISVTTK